MFVAARAIGRMLRVVDLVVCGASPYPWCRFAIALGLHAAWQTHHALQRRVPFQQMIQMHDFGAVVVHWLVCTAAEQLPVAIALVCNRQDWLPIEQHAAASKHRLVSRFVRAARAGRRTFSEKSGEEVHARHASASARGETCARQRYIPECD